MARKPRIHRPGSFYHVMLRGNNKQPIFFSNVDRCRFSLLIQQGIERFGYRIHGYCFMHNHIHLVLQSGESSLSAAMHHLTFRYAKHVNRRERRIGHLFQGRFKAILVDDSTYLLALIRYVHLNPVRAGLVKDAQAYFWSSHNTYLGQNELTWLSQDWILAKFDTHLSIARKAYDKFIKEGLNDTSDSKIFSGGTHEGRLLGTDDFVDQVLKENQETNSLDFTLIKLIDTVCENLKISTPEIRSTSRDSRVTLARGIMAYFVKRAPHLSLKELGDFVYRDSSSLGRLAQGIEKKLLDNAKLVEIINSIKAQLN